jgi:DNA-binding response OmpR family regulator
LQINTAQSNLSCIFYIIRRFMGVQCDLVAIRRPPVPKVLIVEDDKKLQSVFEIILKKEGHDTAVANDGEDALAKAEEFKPDLILLDIMMPNKDGIGFLRDYKAQHRIKPPKIIIFSNLEHVENLDEAYRLGATRYMLKAATTPKDLLALVKQTLEQ